MEMANADLQSGHDWGGGHGNHVDGHSTKGTGGSVQLI